MSAAAPEVEDGVRREPGASFSAEQRIDRAIMLLRPLVVSLAKRCPAGMSKVQTDATLTNLQDAILRLRAVQHAYEVADKARRRA